jgi:hypothetical protein
MTVRRVAVVVAAFVLALAGCGGDDAKEQSQATSTTEERHSLSGTFLLLLSAVPSFRSSVANQHQIPFAEDQRTAC